MSIRSVMPVVAMVGLGVVTALALRDHGYWGIVAPHFATWGGAQVLLDLVILALLACVGMVRDARARGARVWPYVALTLAAGSFGPLLYLAVREAGRRSRLRV